MLEILGRVIGRSRDCDHLVVRPLSEQLWAEPVIEAPTDMFSRYLEVRALFRRHIEAASNAPEPRTGPTEVDRLCQLLSEASNALIHREPTMASEAIETALVIRDRFYVPGQDKPHSVIDGTVAARLIAALLATATEQTKH